MATALAPRVYGLDAICAATLQTGGGEEAAHFARRVFGRVADKDLAAAPADQRAAAAASLLAFARRRLPGVAKVRVFNPPPPTTASKAATPSCRSSTTTCRSWSIRSPTSSIAARSPSTCWRIPCWRRGATSTATFGHRGRGRRAGAVRIDDAYRDRPPGRSPGARRARHGTHPRAGRSAAGGRGLAGDAARLPRRHRRSRPSRFARPRRVRRFPALAGGQPFHLPRPSPLPLCRRSRAARRPALRADARAPPSASCAATRCGCSRPGWAAARRWPASRAGRTTS